MTVPVNFNGDALRPAPAKIIDTALIDDLPLADDRDPIAQRFDLAQHMRREQHRRSGRGPISQERKEPFLHQRVEPLGRLIQEHQTVDRAERLARSQASGASHVNRNEQVVRGRGPQASGHRTPLSAKRAGGRPTERSNRALGFRSSDQADLVRLGGTRLLRVHPSRSSRDRHRALQGHPRRGARVPSRAATRSSFRRHSDRESRREKPRERSGSLRREQHSRRSASGRRWLRGHSRINRSGPNLHTKEAPDTTVVAVALKRSPQKESATRLPSRSCRRLRGRPTRRYRRTPAPGRQVGSHPRRSGRRSASRTATA